MLPPPVSSLCFPLYYGNGKLQMEKQGAVGGESCRPTWIFSFCSWTGKGHVFPEQKERIKRKEKKRKGHIFPAEKEEIKKKKTNGYRK
jgi:hypothetical protein